MIEPSPTNVPTVIEAAGHVRRGCMTPIRLTELCLESIKAHNSTLNAFGDVYTEAALEQAWSMTAELQRGQIRGPLHGIPFGIKDLFSTAGLRTTRGSLTGLENVPVKDAPIIRRLKDAGAIILGKTATTEFGWTGAGTSRVFGNGRNPWDPTLTSGGSSSGSAIAVAARMVPATLGSDGGGSVRIPGAFCGAFALKGTLGRIPTWPWSATEMLSHAGPITRTVRDSALLFDILSGTDPLDHQALPAPGESFLDRCDQPLKPLRIGYCPTLFDTPVDPEIAAAVEAAVAEIARHLPVTLTTLKLDWADPLATFETLWIAGRGIAYGKGLAQQMDQLDPGFAELIRRSAQYDLSDYLHAMQQRAAFANQVHALFEDYDLLLMPTLPILPFAADEVAPAGYIGQYSALPWARWTPFTYPFNLSGNPAASLPCGRSSGGLPIGLQVVGPRFADAHVLQFCAAVEDMAPWDQHVPPMLSR
ncbi:amidase [Pseudomonas cannabina pv. alisalensis]|uniref:Amidase n=2 Tax=Pseudomonas TaxID=286 RepID=A0A8T8C1Z8_PSEYM|nr:MULTISPECIES: amidase family protein [Pseudomonas syringae group]QHE97528.1 amidase [Pseudomonas syringae pv. maculicola str. ES4326]QQN24218.1 amidase [Pseudomonas cannabina pv. alisalensis]UBY98204.1 amidase [Pseudomonas cannabina pv. alisalensis]